MKRCWPLTLSKAALLALALLAPQAGAQAEAPGNWLQGTQVSAEVGTGPAGVGVALGLRGVRLGGGALDFSVGSQDAALSYGQVLALPLLGYAETQTEAQWRWSGGSRLMTQGVLAAGPAELRLGAERFTAPLLRLTPLDTLNDPTPDLRVEGQRGNVSLRYRVQPATFVTLSREWEAGTVTAAEAEWRPQLWSVDGGGPVLARVDPRDLNPDSWAESLGTLRVRLGSEWRSASEDQTAPGLRAGLNWTAAAGGEAELAAILGTHSELTAGWLLYDVLGPESQLRLSAMLTDAWEPGELTAQAGLTAAVPLDGRSELHFQGSAGGAGTAVRVVVLLPLGISQEQ